MKRILRGLTVAVVAAAVSMVGAGATGSIVHTGIAHASAGVIVPNDGPFTTCQQASDSPAGTLQISNACYTWNGYAFVNYSSGPSCTWILYGVTEPQSFVTSSGYVQVSATHGYFACNFDIPDDSCAVAPYNGGRRYSEYMDVYANGSFTHHSYTGGCI